MQGRHKYKLSPILLAMRFVSTAISSDIIKTFFKRRVAPKLTFARARRVQDVYPFDIKVGRWILEASPLRYQTVKVNRYEEFYELTSVTSSAMGDAASHG